MAIATLTIDINARLANIERDLGKVTTLAQRNADKIQKAFAGVSSSVAALGGVLSAGMLASWVRGAADAADRLDEMSERTGVAVEMLNGLDYAIKMNGGSTDELEKGLQNLNKRLSEFAAGDKATTELFKVLGINAGTAEEALLQLADAFPQLSKQDQVRVGADLLGKSYAALVPLLAQGREGLQGMVEEGQRLNPITAEMAKQAAEFNDNLDRLQTLSNAAAMRIGNALIPAINRLTEEFVEGMKYADSFGEALKLFGLQLDPFKGTAGNLAAVREEIAQMDAAMARMGNRDYTTGGSWGQMLFRDDVEKRLAELKKQKAYLEYQQRREALELGDVADPRDRRAAASVLPSISLPSENTPKATKRKADRSDPIADQIARIEEAIRPAEQALERFRNIQQDAAVAGANLTQAERAFFDLVSSPEWASMPESRQELVRANFELANAAERAAAEEARLSALLEATPTAQLERQRDAMRFLADAFERGRISAQQFEEAASAALGNVPEQARDAADATDEFAASAAKNIQSALADFLFDPFENGVEGLGDKFGQLIQRMIADAAAARLGELLFGDLLKSGGSGGGSGNTGWIGTAIGWLSSFADGGIMTSAGPLPLRRYSKGGIANTPQLAEFGEGSTPEAFVPLPDGRSIPVSMSGSSRPSITVNVTVPSGTATEIRRAAGATGREVSRAVMAAQRYA